MWGFLFIFLTGFSCFSIFLPLPLQSLCSSFCTVFDAISSKSNIDKVFSISLSSKVFIFTYFHVLLKNWLNFSEELIYLLKFVVIFNQYQATLLRWSIFLLESETEVCTVLCYSSLALIYTWFLAVLVAAIAHWNNFHLYQRDKGKRKRGSLYRLTVFAKGFLKLSSLPMLIEQKNLSLCRDFECWDFWQIF